MILFNGQWIGRFEGTNKGELLLNLEYKNNSIKGRIIAYDEDRSFPSFLAEIDLSETSTGISGSLANFRIIHTIRRQYIGLEKAIECYPDIIFPNVGEVEIISADGDTLSGSWKTNINSSGNFTATIYRIDASSSLTSTINSWEDYKKYVSSTNGYIYRGQSTPHKLSTLYHRLGRSDLISYSQHNIPVLHRYISSLPNHLFNLSDPSQYAALVNLAQHHGYPTPLLDWTKSPYVAAYFAFSDIPKEQKEGHIRLFMFDINSWTEDLGLNVMPSFDLPYLTLQAIEPLAICNSRMLPQQSVTTFTNISDIEEYIKHHESILQKKYLIVVDLPVTERQKVMMELDQMGITAASLFPGLDGICKSLKEKYF